MNESHTGKKPGEPNARMRVIEHEAQIVPQGTATGRISHSANEPPIFKELPRDRKTVGIIAAGGAVMTSYLLQSMSAQAAMQETERRARAMGADVFGDEILYYLDEAHSINGDIEVALGRLSGRRITAEEMREAMGKAIQYGAQQPARLLSPEELRRPMPVSQDFARSPIYTTAFAPRPPAIVGKPVRDRSKAKQARRARRNNRK